VDPLAKVVNALSQSGVRFVLIGVAGANYYGVSDGIVFATHDAVCFLRLIRTTW
jgi:hypothetical protein